LEKVVHPLSYSLLNDTVNPPTDENLARWIRGQFGTAGLAQVGVQSTVDQGADLDRNDNVHLWRRYRFESAHRLPRVPIGHKCGRMHGHGFEVILHVNTDLDGKDIAIDYDLIDARWQPIHDRLHLKCLNEIPGLENPTSENLSSWIWQQLKQSIPELSWVTVYETATCGANFDGANYRIWKEFTLDSAVRLSYAPSGDPRGEIHGHTFVLRLHLAGPIDTVMGWTIDFGDVKQLFDPIFKKIDHQPLYDLPGIKDTDCASVARWLKRQTCDLVPGLNRIDLYQTRGCGAILTWEGSELALPV